jgi:hypothetical protein
LRSFCAFAKLPAINNRKAIMAGVNGVEIKVGQVWRQRDGKLVRIARRERYGRWGTVHVGEDTEMADINDDGTSDLIDETYGLAELVEQTTDSATLAEETLSALGWTFDGQAWIESGEITMAPNALDVQVGGTHYKDCAIQPIEYIHANKLGFAEGNVVKYITRHRQKHGADDVRKVIHYCQLLLELEYGATAKENPNG